MEIIPILMCLLLVAIAALLVFISGQLSDGIEQLERLNSRPDTGTHSDSK